MMVIKEGLMPLSAAIENQGLSISLLAQHANLSYTTVYNIAHGKVSLTNCRHSTVLKLSHALDVEPDLLLRTDDFRHFRDQLHTILKQEGIEVFLMHSLSDLSAIQYYKAGWTARAMYIMCLTDYLCEIEKLPVPSEYDFLREKKLTPPMKIAEWDCENLKYIPVFEKHGILEGEVFDAV